MHWDEPANRNGQTPSTSAQESAAHYTERIIFYAELLAQKRGEHAPDKTIAALQSEVARYGRYLTNYLAMTKDVLSKRENNRAYLITGRVAHSGKIVEIRDHQNRIVPVLPTTLDRVPKLGERVMVMFNREGRGTVSTLGEHQLMRASGYQVSR